MCHYRGGYNLGGLCPGGVMSEHLFFNFVSEITYEFAVAVLEKLLARRAVKVDKCEFTGVSCIGVPRLLYKTSIKHVVFFLAANVLHIDINSMQISVQTVFFIPENFNR